MSPLARTLVSNSCQTLASVRTSRTLVLAMDPKALHLKAILSGHDPLFSGGDLDDVVDDRRRRLKEQIREVHPERLLTLDTARWAAELAGRYRLEPVQVDESAISYEEGSETYLDVRHERDRRVRDRSKAAWMPAHSMTLCVPFSGDDSLLALRGNPYLREPPNGKIVDRELRYLVVYAEDRDIDLKAEADRFLGDLRFALAGQATLLATFNGQLEAFATAAIEYRKRTVLTQRERLDKVGIPVRRRADAPKVFRAPGIERRPTPTVPARRDSGVPQTLEPVLVDEFYEHIMSVILAMARGMERQPGDYRSWGEEQLRDALLTILNTHYQGAATGETFQRAGKTDVLVRVEDRNVFVGELKWWSGEQAFAGTVSGADRSALDQLLSYSTWRDAKLALVLFVAAKDITGVIARARRRLEDHDAFSGWASASDAEDGMLRCRVRLAGDREADLTCVFVHLPDV